MKRGIVTTVVFTVLIFTGTAGSVLAKERAFSDTENRSLKTYPKFTWKSYLSGEFAEQYEEYVKDQFPMRNELVAMKNYCDMALLKKEIKGVLIGKDGSFIENHPESVYETELAKANAAALAQFGMRMGRLLGKEHAGVMIVPTAQTVMTEAFPDFAWVYDQSAYIDSIAGYAAQAAADADAGADGTAAEIFLNVTETLRQHSGEYIYYRTDHHWTGLGAFYAYEYWAEKKGYEKRTRQEFSITEAATDFLGTVHSKLNISMRPDTIFLWDIPEAEYEVTINLKDKKDSFYDMSFLEKKDKYSVFFGGNPGLAEIKAKGFSGNGKTLLVVKDSYANCFVPIAAAGFEHIYMIDLRYFNMNVDAFVKTYGVTDVLVLYNADSAATDAYVKRLGDK